MVSVLDLVKHYQNNIAKYPDDEQKILKCIDKLFHLDVKVQHLQETGVGRTVNALRKEPGDVGKAARALVYKWKIMVAAEESDQEGDHNDSSTHNGHGNGKNDDGHHSQSRYPKDNKQINGDPSRTKRKHTSEEEEPDIKKTKQTSASDYDDNKKNIKHEVKSEPSSSSEDSDSHSESDDESDSSEEDKKEVKVKVEPPEQTTPTSKHSKSSHSNHKTESSSSKRSHAPPEHHNSKSSKHSSDSKYSEHSSSKSLHESKDKSSKDKDYVEKKGKEHKSHKEDSKSSKHSSDKHSERSSSQKTESTSDRHKNHERNKSDKHSSSKSDKEKYKSSSETKISTDDHKIKESSSKERSSSSKDKSKDKSSSSKDKSSSHSSRSDKKHSSGDKSRSESKSYSERSGDRSSEKRSSHKSSSEKSKQSSSSKSKEDKPKKKVTVNTDSDDGIGFESGASFAEALGMAFPSKSKKKQHTPVKDAISPNNQIGNDLSPAALLAPTAKLAPLPALEISALPEISPNYKPRPPPKFTPHFTDDDALNISISSKNQRTKVYSGNKILGRVPSLYEMCVNILQEHIDALEYTGGVPYEILKPVVDKASPQQLFVLEHYNPYLMEDTDHLWQKHCEKHFRNKKRQEMETWREMYIRCQEEQEHKLKSLTANIRMTQEAKKAPIKQTKMAYVDTVVKPPRNIARKQALHGTAHSATASPAARVASLASGPNVLKGGAVRPPSSAPVSASSFNKPKKAPLMAKALQFMRGRKR